MNLTTSVRRDEVEVAGWPLNKDQILTLQDLRFFFFSSSPKRDVLGQCCSVELSVVMETLGEYL